MKSGQTEFYNIWYQLWMKQSREFFESANIYLKDFFEQGKIFNPEEHQKEINKWLTTLKSQWDFVQLNAEQQQYADYWKMMIQMCNEAAQLMLQQWIQRAKENNPVKSIHELYTLWLNACQEVYTKSLHSKAYQEAYAHFMNAALKFWETNSYK